jgi:hypothetical protein
MTPHQERVVQEKKDLDEKIEKLKTFTGGTVYPNLDAIDQFLLSDQLTYMEGYSRTLGHRIGRF